MATIYECDVTGEQFTDEERVREVGIYDTHGTWVEFEFGPNATIDAIRERLKEHVEEFEPFHPEWYDTNSDVYNPPRLEEVRLMGEKADIKIPTVTQQS